MATTTAVIQERTYTNLELALYQKSADGTSLRTALATVLGGVDEANSFLVEVGNQARTVPALHRCTIDSVRFHLLRVAQLHLNPALPNEVSFIPRNQKQPDGKTWAMELTIQYGYGGLRKLVMRSPDVVDCFTKEVCANDRFEPPSLPISLPVHQLPSAFQPRGRVIGYYAAAQLRNGNWRTMLMSVAEVERHADTYAKDKDGKFGPAWQKGKRPDLEDGLCPFDKMALKTCLRMLCNARDLSLTAELQEALALEPVIETSAEHQGYTREGTRPAVTMGSGMSMADLMQDLGGAQDKEAVTVYIERETRTTKQASVPMETPHSSAKNASSAARTIMEPSETPDATTAHPDAKTGVSPDPTNFVYLVEELWRGAGLTPEDIRVRWDRQVKRFGGPIDEHAYPGILLEQQAWAAQRQREQVRVEDPEDVTDVSAFTPEEGEPF